MPGRCAARAATSCACRFRAKAVGYARPAWAGGWRRGAALLVDPMLPAVGYRQWVLSFEGRAAVHPGYDPGAAGRGRGRAGAGGDAWRMGGRGGRAGAGRGVGVLDGLVLGVDLAVVVGGETDPSLEQEIAGLKTELGKVEQHGRLQSAVLTVARDPDARVSGFSDDEHAKIQREGVGLRRL